MAKGERALYLMIYILMLVFGGIGVIMSDVLTPIFAISDPMVVVIMFLFSLGLFFVVIPYIIWNGGKD